MMLQFKSTLLQNLTLRRGKNIALHKLVFRLEILEGFKAHLFTYFETNGLFFE